MTKQTVAAMTYKTFRIYYVTTESGEPHYKVYKKGDLSGTYLAEQKKWIGTGLTDKQKETVLAWLEDPHKETVLAQAENPADTTTAKPKKKKKPRKKKASK